MAADEQQKQVSFVCSSCGQRVSSDARSMGLRVGCPHCGTVVTVPPSPPASAAPQRGPIPLASQGAGKFLKRAALLAGILVPAQVLILALGFMLIRSAHKRKDVAPLSRVDETVVSPAEAGATVGEASSGPTGGEEAGKASREAEAEKASREAEAERARREAEAERRRREVEGRAEQEAADAAKPTTRFVVRIAAGEYGLAGKVIRGDGRQYMVPVAGVTKEWRVRKVGRWGGGEQAAIIPERPLDNGIQLMGKHAGTGVEMPLASIKPDDGGLLFTREPGTNDQQLEACLGDVAWIELYCPPEKKTVFVVTRALERTIQIKREGRWEEARGEIALPSPLAEVFKENEDKLKYPESLTDTGRYTAQVAYTLNGSDLTVGIAYSYETPAQTPRAEEVLRKANEELQAAEAKLNDVRGAAVLLDRARGRRAVGNPDDAQRRLVQAMEDKEKAAEAVKRAEEYLAQDEDQAQRRERAFGHFPGSLEFSLEDQVIAAFTLELK